ncbi:unnamed protein product [Lampetra planeri]
MGVWGGRADADKFEGGGVAPLLARRVVGGDWWAVSVGGAITSVGGAITSVGGAITSVGGAITRVGGAITSVGGAITSVGGAITSVGGAITSVGGAITSVGGAIASVGGACRRGWRLAGPGLAFCSRRAERRGRGGGGGGGSGCPPSLPASLGLSPQPRCLPPGSLDVLRVASPFPSHARRGAGPRQQSGNERGLAPIGNPASATGGGVRAPSELAPAEPGPAGLGLRPDWGGRARPGRVCPGTDEQGRRSRRARLLELLPLRG